MLGNLAARQRDEGTPPIERRICLWNGYRRRADNRDKRNKRNKC